MSTFIVSYDLRQPGRDYKSLYQALQSYPGREHPLESVWVVVGNTTATEVRNHLQQHIDANDGLLVVGSSGAGAWVGLSTALSEWLKENL